LKILLVYPQYPDTFWGFKHALKFISKKAAHPPLGLLTVAAMLPGNWDKKLVDMNVTGLKDKDIKWADYVFISAMAIQGDSARNIIKRCLRFGTKVVAGGPLFTTEHAEFPGVDHFVLNEAEATLQPFIEDLAKGCAKHIYTSAEWPDISVTPVPAWGMINMKKYSSLSIQYSRGCPFDCEFCDIVVLNGHKPRTKGRQQLLAEFDAIYNAGWRGSVFIVDDNFIGNKKKLKEETLPAVIEWMTAKRRPFTFLTEASMNLADDEDLMQLMVKAGFDTVFVGIETTNEDSLFECGKGQNRNRDLVSSVKILHNHGLQVHGGFIVGFDNDPVSIFETMISFIQKSGVVTAMVGLLNAPPGTKLQQRLLKENRMVENFSGNNTAISMNFIPTMNYDTLVNGYKKILNTIYSPKKYYERVKVLLKDFHPPSGITIRLPREHIGAFIKSVWVLGIRDKGRQYYWRLLGWTLVKRPRAFSKSVTMAIYGFHFRKITEAMLDTRLKPGISSKGL
jgi:radical SAM superfamily enzyme YgiQ (UPF0313 family)